MCEAGITILKVVFAKFNVNVQIGRHQLLVRNDQQMNQQMLNGSNGGPMMDGEDEHRALCTCLSAPAYGQLPARRPLISPPTDTNYVWA